MEGQYIIRVKDKEKGSLIGSRRVSVENRNAFSLKNMNEYMTKTPRSLKDKFAS